MGNEIQKAESRALEFSPEQRQMIRDSFASGATDPEFAVLMEVARVRRLNPLLRQIHFVQRWDPEKERKVWAYQVAIDGFRAIAERTGKYDGQDEPEFVYDDKGKLVACKVKVYRKDWSRPAVGIAHFAEYVQTKKDGSPNRTWATKGHIMIAKCAEAAAFRKAFPEDTAGLYVEEELGADETPTAAPPKPERAVVSPADALADIIRKAPTEADLTSLVPKIKLLPAPEQTKLRDVYGARKRELEEAKKQGPHIEDAEEIPAGAEASHAA